MLFAVVRLRDRGRALTRTEIEAQPRAVGDLCFCLPPVMPNPNFELKRPAKHAELRGEAIGNIEHTLIHSLMDPVVQQITKDGMVIFGYEIEITGRERREYVQAWLVQHVRQGEKRMRRGDVPMAVGEATSAATHHPHQS